MFMSKITLPKKEKFNSTDRWIIFAERFDDPELNHFREVMLDKQSSNTPYENISLYFLSEMSYGVQDGKRYVVCEGKTLFEGDTNLPKIVFIRDNKIELAMHLEAMGLICSPSSQQILLASNKAITASVLAGVVPMPDTACIVGNEYNDTTFDCSVIMKPYGGNCGTNVLKVDNKEMYDTARLEADWKNTLIQECMPTGVDVRVYMYCNKIAYAVKRIPPENSYKANICSGGIAEKYELNDKEYELAANVGAAFAKGKPLGLLAVDFLFDKNGQFTLCEVNTSPGIKGIVRTHNIEADDIIKGYIDEAYKEAMNIIDCCYKVGGTD